MEISPIMAGLLGFGSAGIIGVTVAEKFVPLVPSYVLLTLLGMAASSTSGLATMVVATTVGSTIASLCWYGLGRALGSRRVEALVAGYGRLILLPTPLYRRLAERYRHNQFWATLIGHSVPVVRIYIGLPAGVFRLELRQFITAAMLGSFVWNAPLLGLGFLLRGNGGDPFGLGLVVAIVLVGVEFAILWGIRLQRRMRA